MIQSYTLHYNLQQKHNYDNLTFLALLFAKSCTNASKLSCRAKAELKYSIPKEERRLWLIVDRRSSFKVANPLKDRCAPATETGKVQKRRSATQTFGNSPSKFSSDRRLRRCRGDRMSLPRFSLWIAFKCNISPTSYSEMSTV